MTTSYNTSSISSQNNNVNTTTKNSLKSSVSVDDKNQSLISKENNKTTSNLENTKSVNETSAINSKNTTSTESITSNSEILSNNNSNNITEYVKKSINTKSTNNETNTTKISTKMTINSKTLYPYQVYTMVATVVDKNSTYVNSGNVTFKINNQTIGCSNVTNGKAIIKYTIPALEAGNYIITTTYSGSDTLYSTNAIGTLTILKYSTIAYASPISTKTNTTTQFKAVIKTITGAFVKNGTVIFKIDNQTIGNSNITNGVSLLNYTIPASWKSGYYTITVEYMNTTIYDSCNTTNTLKVSTPIQTSTTITINSTTFYSYETYKFIATVKDKNNNSVNTGNVTFQINNSTIGYANVTNGIAILNYTLPKYTANNYTITSLYVGNNNYKTSNNSVSITIDQYNTTIFINNITGAYGHNTTFTAIIKTNTGTVVKEGTVIFKVNNTTIGTVNVTNGIAQLIYEIPTSWAYKQYVLSATYNSNVVYKGSSINSTLTVGQLFTYSDILTAASNLKKYITKYAEMPDYISITGEEKTELVSKCEFLYLMTKALYTNSDVITYNISNRANTTENLNSTNAISKLNYLLVANNFNNFVETYGIAPRYATTVDGKMGINSLIYMYASILTYNLDYYSLPGNITVVSKESLSNTSSSYSIPSSYSTYLSATTNCQSTSSTITSLAKSIISGVSGTYNQAVAIFNYINDNTYYSSYSNTQYGALGTWTRGYGNCADLTHLLIAVMRAAGIPARYVHGYCTFSSGNIIGHVWAEVYVNSKWYTCDVSSYSNFFGVVNNWNSTIIYSRYSTLPF